MTKTVRTHKLTESKTALPKLRTGELSKDKLAEYLNAYRHALIDLTFGKIEVGSKIIRLARSKIPEERIQAAFTNTVYLVPIDVIKSLAADSDKRVRMAIAINEAAQIILSNEMAFREIERRFNIVEDSMETGTPLFPMSRVDRIQ
jgi:hypothetical protein